MPNEPNSDDLYLETYQGVDIYMCKEIAGGFRFYLDGKHIYFNLAKAKEVILAILKFTKRDFSDMLAKLDNKEKEFITAIVEELQAHFSSSWCDVDVDLPYFIDNF